MKPTVIFILCVFLIFRGIGFAGNTISDSTNILDLQNQLQSTPNENKSVIFNNLSSLVLPLDSEKSFAYADSALKIAVKYQDTIEMLNSLKNKAEALFILDRFDEAAKLFEEAFNFAKIKGKDTLMAKLMYSQGLAYYNMNAVAKAEDKLLEAEKNTRKLNLVQELAESCFFLGAIYADKGNYSEALNWYYQSLDEAKLVNSEQLIADIYNNVGIVYQDLGSYEKALKNYSELLQIAQKTGNKRRISFAYNNIGIVYYDWGKKEKALEYYQKSQQIDEELGDQAGIADYYNNVGIIYDDWGQSDLAIGYYTKAIEIYNSFNNLEGIANAVNNLGESLASLGQYDKAIEKLNESLAIEQKLGSPFGVANSYHTIGNIYFNKGDTKQAIIYNDKCLHLADSIGMAQLQMIANELNFKIYAKTGNFKKALEYYQLFEQQKDSIYNDRFHQRIIDVQIEKEAEKNEQLRDLANKELIKKEQSISVQRIYLFIILILMLVFGVLVYFDFRNKNKNNRKLSDMNSMLLEHQKELSETLDSLTKSESKYRHLVENSPNGILYLDAEGNILEINKKLMEVLFVKDQEEFKKINALDFQPLKDIGIANDLHKCIAEKKIIYNEGFFENQLGENVFLKFLVFPVMNNKKEVVSLIVHVEDVTPVLIENRKRKDMEIMYRILVENSLQALLIVQEMRLIFANSKMEELTQYSIDELQAKGRRWVDILIHPKDFKRAFNNIRNGLGGKENQAKYQYEIIRRDGQIRHMETLTSIVNYKGKPAMIIVAIDITERLLAKNSLEKSESRLRELNAMKDKFFSIIAHDLKNPFNAILGFSSLLNEAYDNFTDAQRKEFIKNICTSSENTFKLLQNLLEWSRTQTGKIDFFPNYFMLDKIIQEIQTLMMPVFTNKEVQLVNSVPKDLKVYADSNMIRFVVRNLLSNAYKFTYSKQGRVEISAKQNKNNVEVWVKDNGVGITKETQKQIFRVDNQVKTSGTNNESGSGLGLILCKEFVEKNGGKLAVESELGNGSIFSFNLPVSKPEN